MKVEFTIPMTKNLLASEANLQREHWTKKKKRHDIQRWLIDTYCTQYLYANNKEPIDWLPCRLILNRIAPRTLDGDNLQYSLKWTRDAIAANLIIGKAPGQADGDPRIEWIYKQEKGGVREYALRITIEKVDSLSHERI